jgi:spermidine synthase
MQTTEKDEFNYSEMLTHVPLNSFPNIDKVKDVLIIGSGDGSVLKEVCKYPSISNIVMVEIDERVCKLSKQFIPEIACEMYNEKNANRVTLLNCDGIKFVKEEKDGKYDLIIVDSTDPFPPGETLFTEVFYQNCYRILKADGILTNQHETPYFDDNAKMVKLVHDRLAKIFPIKRVYQTFVPSYPSG